MNLLFNNKKVTTPSMAAKLNNLPSTPHLPDEDLPTPMYEQPHDGSSRHRNMRKIALGVSVLAVVGTVAAVALNQTQDVARASASFGSAATLSAPQHNNQGAPSNLAQFAELDSLADFYKLRLQLDAAGAKGPQRANQAPEDAHSAGAYLRAHSGGYHANSAPAIQSESVGGKAPQHANQAPPAHESDLAEIDSIHDFNDLHEQIAAAGAKAPQRANQAPPAQESLLAQVDSLRDVYSLREQLAAAGGKSPQHANQAPPAYESLLAQVDSLRDFNDLHIQVAAVGGKSPQRANQAAPADEFNQAHLDSIVDEAADKPTFVEASVLAEFDKVLKVLKDLHQHNARHQGAPASGN